MRQQGRERAANVIDTAPNEAAILTAVNRARSAEFRDSLRGMVNPYGDGTASQKIVEVLTTTPLGEKLLIKKAR
jgi:UDP-N-acetylglucosamine 2-epimerase